MLHKIDLGSDRAVGFSWEGEFDVKGFKQSVVQFLPELQSRAHMDVYIEVYEITDVQARALWDELKFDLQNYRQLSQKIDKVALVTRETWLRNLAVGYASLLPGIRLKAFTFEEKEAAKKWVL